VTPAATTTATTTASATARPEQGPDEGCLARDVLARVGDKWSVYVIHLLGQRTMRFSELRRSVDGISQRMLTVTLRGLERDGLVEREIFAEVPPRVQYSLTPMGASLLDVVGALVDWSAGHTRAIATARARYDQATDPMSQRD
jgi:DNA-binding HxlR family transcriptional regulator